MKSQSHSKSKLFAYKKDRKPKSHKQAKISFYDYLMNEKKKKSVDMTRKIFFEPIEEIVSIYNCIQFTVR